MDNQSTAHIFKALQTVGDLISLANNSDVLRNDKVCDILLRVMQHCACRIHREVERKRQAPKAKGQGPQRILTLQQKQRLDLNKSIMILGALLILVTAVAGPANAALILSADATESLGRLSFADGDLIEYSPITYAATLYFNESLFGNNADIDGVYVASMPEPATIVTLGLGCMVLVRQRPKQKKRGKGAGKKLTKLQLLRA